MTFQTQIILGVKHLLFIVPFRASFMAAGILEYLAIFGHDCIALSNSVWVPGLVLKLFSRECLLQLLTCKWLSQVQFLYLTAVSCFSSLGEAA